MAVEDDADRAIFFDDDDFGVMATITPSGGAPYTAQGIFTEPHSVNGIRQANGYSNQADLSGQKPMFRARTTDVASLRNGRATLVINGVEYTAFDVKPDGTGTTSIQLMKA